MIVFETSSIKFMIWLLFPFLFLFLSGLVGGGKGMEKFRQLPVLGPKVSLELGNEMKKQFARIS